MTFETDGGIEWEHDTTNKIFTIRPAANPQSGYVKGKMKNYDYSHSTRPWENIKTDCTLVIEDGVLTIGDYAFDNCTGLKGTLTFPEGLTEIRLHAFNRCTGFTGPLAIPDSVTKIGEYAFVNCTGFNGTLKLSKNLYMIEDKTFSYCSGLIGTLDIPASVEIINFCAFEGCSGFNGALILGPNVNAVGDYAFASSSNFNTIEFEGPSKPYSVGTDAFKLTTTGSAKTYTVVSSGWATSETFPEFEYTKWTFTNYNIDGGIEWYNDSTNKMLILKPANSPEEGYTAGQMKRYTQDAGPPWGTITTSGYALILRDGITNIGRYAFEACWGFTGTLNLPDTVTNIDLYAFDGCRGFTGELVLPENLKTIDMYSFQYCKGFTGNLTIPESVTYISFDAFYDCTGINGVLTIKGGSTLYIHGAFIGLSNISKIIFDGGKPDFDDEAFKLNHDAPEKTYSVYSDGWATLETFPEFTYTKWAFEYPEKYISIKVNGEWRTGIPYIKKDGVWIKGTPYIKKDGVWR